MSDVVPVMAIMPSHPSQGDFVEINVSDFDPAKHTRYVAPLPKAAVVPLPVPPPAAPNPLKSLPSTWRETMKATEIRALAERVSGRTPDDKVQAIQMIEAALAK